MRGFSITTYSGERGENGGLLLSRGVLLATYNWFLFSNGSWQPHPRALEELWHSCTLFPTVHSLALEPLFSSNTKPFFGQGNLQANLLFTRHALARTGAPDPALDTPLALLDLSLRALHAGMPTIHLPNIYSLNNPEYTPPPAGLSRVLLANLPLNIILQHPLRWRLLQKLPGQTQALWQKRMRIWEGSTITGKEEIWRKAHPTSLVIKGV